MKRKRKIYDRLEFTGNHEKDLETSKERLRRLKEKDLSFLGYGIVKRTLKNRIIKWTKTKIKWLMNKVQIFQK